MGIGACLMALGGNTLKGELTLLKWRYQKFICCKLTREVDHGINNSFCPW